MLAEVSENCLICQMRWFRYSNGNQSQKKFSKRKIRIPSRPYWNLDDVWKRLAQSLTGAWIFRKAIPENILSKPSLIFQKSRFSRLSMNKFSRRAFLISRIFSRIVRLVGDRFNMFLELFEGRARPSSRWSFDSNFGILPDEGSLRPLGGKN